MARRIEAEVDLDVLALTSLCRSTVGGMRARRRGRILNVSSTACFAPGPNVAVYHAAKAYDAVCVPGRLNWALVKGARLTPRGVVRRASGKVVERVVASPGPRR